MQKFILFFILTIILLCFGVFFIQVYQEQKSYYDGQNNPQILESPTPFTEIDTPSVYKDYTKLDYDTSLVDKRVMVLFFTANWCAECLTQDTVNVETFVELNKEGVVGLRIHTLDSETTTESDAIAKKFDVTKESSFVILDKSGKVSSKYVGSISKENLRQLILTAKEVE